MKETELYAPVRKWLESAGMRVRAEVLHCDLAAAHGDMLTVVELKTVLNLDVILQAVDRQLTADFVYVAVPRRERTVRSQRWRRLLLLLKRLELGLLLVPEKAPHAVEVVLQPVPYDLKAGRSQRAKQRRQMMKELMDRMTDENIGGSSQRALVTVYREKALQVAVLLKVHGESTPAQLKRRGADPDKTSGILYDNHYRWFDRIGRGYYRLNESGERALDSWGHAVEQMAEAVSVESPPSIEDELPETVPAASAEPATKRKRKR